MQRFHFVLSTHNKYSPSLRLITPDKLDAYLNAATIEYLEQLVFVNSSTKEVVLPKIFKWFQQDFGDGYPKQMLKWILGFLQGTKKRKN